MKRLNVILISLLLAAAAARAQGPSTTTISDVVYRADGTPAGGTLLISWPAFESAGGQAIAAGSKSLTLGAGGVVNVALVPNEGATPSGTYYKVVYKLDDGSTSQELWSVPNVPTTTIAAIRSTVVPAGVAIQVASRQYVDTQLAAVSGTRFHNVRYCDQFGGADAGARILACINDLPATGGTADARGLEGAQTISATIVLNKSVTLLLGHATFTCSTGAAFCFTGTEKRAIIVQGSGANETDTAGAAATSGTKFVWAGSGANGIFKFTGVENLEISDLALDGNNIANGVGMELLNGTIDTSSVHFRRLSVSYFAGKGAKLSASGAAAVDTSSFDDVTFRSNGVGLSFESNQAVGWDLRRLRFINNTTGLETLNGGGFHCLNCSWSSTVNPSTAAKLTSVSDNITFQNNTFEMDTGGTALTSSAPGCSGLRCIVRLVGSRLDKSGTLGQDLITWNSQINLYVEASRIKDGIIRLNNVIDDMNESVHTFIGNWFHGTLANSDLVLDTTANGNRVYRVFEYNNQQSADIAGAIIRPLVRMRKVHTSVIDRSEFGPRIVTNTPISFTSLDATPSVSGGTFFKTANAGATTITAFDDGVRGQIIHVVFNDANTTVSDAGTLRLLGTLTSAPDDSITLIYDGVDWFEIGRSSVGAGGDSISVNSTAASNADFDDATPAAPANAVNVKWQKDALSPNNLSAHLLLTDVDGAGLGVSGSELVAASAEASFLADGGATDLICGASNQGKAQVMDNGVLQWCDGAATSVLQRSALGDAGGNALAGDSATGFFSAGQIEAARGGTGDDTSATTGVARVASGNWTYDAGISHLASSSSADLAAVLSNETGSGNAVFSADPALSGTVTINRRLEFTEAAGDPACAAGDFWISATSSTNLLRKCQNGSLSDLDTGGAGGDSISVNGTAASNADFDDATPAAPADGVNVRWQKDTLSPNNVSANLQFATTSLSGAISTAAQTMAGEKTFSLANTGTSDKTALSAIADSQNSAGTRANLIAFESTAKQTVPGGTTTNAYGVMIRSAVESAGTITNAYGLRVEPQTVGTAENNFDVDAGTATGSFTSNLQLNYIKTAQSVFKIKDPTSDKLNALQGIVQVSNASGGLSVWGSYGAAESTHPSGTVTRVAGNGGDAMHSGAGAVTDLTGQTALVAALSGAGNITRAAAFESYAETRTGYANTVTDLYGFRARTNARAAGTVTNNYGIRIENQAGVGTNNFAISTGTGLVRLGDDLDFGTDNADDIGASGANRPRTIYAGTSLVTPTVNATTALHTNGTTRIDSTGVVNNVTLDAEGTGNSVTTVSKFWFDGAGCQNTTALLNWDTPTAGAAVAACRTGTNTQQGTLDFATDSGSLTAQRKIRLPSDWAAGSNIDALVVWNTSAIVNDVVWQIAIACAGDAESDDPAFTDDAFTADTAKATANQLNDTAVNTVATTGACAAGKMAYVRIKRDSAHASDTLAAGTTARLLGVELTLRRTQ